MVTSKFHTGLVVFWSLSAFFDRAKLKAGWQEAGYTDSLPEERDTVSVLKDALQEVFVGSRFLVRPLSTRNGFTVVKEIRGEDQNSFETVLTAKVFGNEVAIVGDQAKKQEILDAYLKHTGRFTSQQVSAALVRLLQQKLGGTRLRPSGALYWLEGKLADAWRTATDAVEASAVDGKATAYVISHELDSDSIIAVRDAIQVEISSEAKRISDDIINGDLGERAIKARKAAAVELKRKTEHYEHILGVTLTNLKSLLDDIEHSNACATLLLAANPFQDSEREVGNVATA